MNLIKQFFHFINREIKDDLDIDSIILSPPKMIMDVTNEINTVVRLTSPVSQIDVKYRRRDIAELVRFNHTALKKVRKNKKLMTQYLNGFFKLNIQEHDFELTPNELRMSSSCYFYVGSAPLTADDEKLTFNVTAEQYSKICKFIKCSEVVDLYRFLIEVNGSVREIDTGLPNTIFSSTINDMRAEISLDSGERLIFIVEQ